MTTSFRAEDLPAVLFQTLRRMDDEANTLINGHITSLNWYGGFSRPSLKKPQTEPEWAVRLAQLLPDVGLEIYRDNPQKRNPAVTYPGLNGKSCDLVLKMDKMRFWVEIKGAWKYYWWLRSQLDIYESYLFYPMKPCKSKTHTAALDLKRLATLHREDAAYSGLLLIGFDSLIKEADMTEDISEFRRLGNLYAPVWEEAYDSWADRHYLGDETARVRCWFWYRDVS